MTSCPDCGSSDLEDKGIERGERLDDSHAVLVSRFRCRVCGCEFKEVQVTSWRTEVTKRGSYEKLLMLEVEH